MTKSSLGIFVCIILNSVHFVAYNQTHAVDLVVPDTIIPIVILNNSAKKIPLIDIDQMKIVRIKMTFDYATAFDSLLNKYQNVDHLDYNSLDVLNNQIKPYNTLIIQMSETDVMNEGIMSFIRATEKSKNIIIAYFGTGENLKQFDRVKSSIIWSEQANIASAMYMAQVIFGGIAVDHTLKKSYSKVYQVGLGSAIQKIRLAYTNSDNNTIDVNRSYLQYIDSIALEAINVRATPSIVVMVVKDGQVVYHKAFGTHTYDDGLTTHIDDIYDLASITKIAATTLVMMQLTEKGKVKLNKSLKTYLPEVKKLDKGPITLRQLMLHEAGLIPYISFYNKLDTADYHIDSSNIFTTPLSAHCYLRKNYLEQVMWPQILQSHLKHPGHYVYSDLSMYFIQKIIERVSREKLDEYVSKRFYKPLGMKTAGFNPRNRFDKNKIVPTENDTTLRKSLLLGYVQDLGAAMCHGVAGHAGLFANANDLAILSQMLLNHGSYGGKSYFLPHTVDLFRTKQSKVSRRGLGFDRTDPDTKKAYPCQLASPSTYGHTGYTGTCMWIDPTNQLIYIFLSNSGHPRYSKKLIQLNTRSRIQDMIYEAINQH